jgi:hypothetical protein
MRREKLALAKNVPFYHPKLVLVLLWPVVCEQGRIGQSGNETLVVVAFSISHTKFQKKGLLDFFVWNVAEAF